MHDFVTVYCEKCGHSERVMLRCGDRTCPDCRKRDFFRLFRGYEHLFRSKSRLRFLTLTLRNTSNLSLTSVDFLRNCFRKLLRSSSLSGRISGGMYGIEIVNKGKGWNIHLHAIIEGQYLPQDELSREWRRITGGSYIVWVTKFDRGVEGLRYILKYLLKSPCLSGQEDTYNAYMKGVRMFSFFGSWFPAKLIKTTFFKCPICGCVGWISEFELDRLSRTAVEVDNLVEWERGKKPP